MAVPTRDARAAHDERPPERAFERSPLWRLKVRLQFTGWLQYLPNALLVLVLLAVAAAASELRLPGVATVGLTLAFAAAAVLAFDVGTVRLGLHPAEPLPSPRDDADAFALMRARRSCRSFQRRELTEAHRTRLLDAATRASAPGERLGSAPIRFEYVAARLTVWPTVGAHEFLVAIAPKAYDRTAIIDVGRALQKVVHEATRMGVATCWIGPGADRSSAAQHLAGRFDPGADHIICLCAIGYASRYVPATVRLLTRSMSGRKPLSELFFADATLSTPLDTARPEISGLERVLEACRWAPSSFNAQTSRAVVVTNPAAGREEDGDHGDLVRVDFGAATGSAYYAPVAVGIWFANWEAGTRALGLDGRFEIMSDAAGAAPSWPAPARYDASWIPAR